MLTTGRPKTPPRVSGHVVEIERREDGPRQRIDLFVHPKGAPAHHVAVGLILRPDRPVRLHVGFAAEVREVCLPEHLPAQDAVVRAAQLALKNIEGLDAPAPLVAALGRSWRTAREGLAARMDAAAKAGMLANGVRFVRTPEGAEPCLVARRTCICRTSYGLLTEAFVAQRSESGTALRRADHPLPEPVTPEALARIAGLSGHRTLDLMSAAARPAEDLRAAFLLRPRLPGRRALPVLREGWIGHQERGPGASWRRWNVSTPDGTDAELLAVLEEGGAPRLEVTLSLPMRAYLKIEVPRDGGEARIAHEPGLAQARSPEALDAALQRAMEILIAADPDLPDAVPGTDGNAANPVLAWLDVPPRLRAAFDTALGAPYHAARADAAAVAAAAAKAAARIGVPGNLADGAVVGKLVPRLDPALGVQAAASNKSRFGVVRTLPPAAAGLRTRRVIAPMHGYRVPRPLTQKHLNRMPRATRPGALRRMPDALLGGERRDHLETAFRLSFRLEGGARNPILECEPRIHHDPAEGDFLMRRTEMEGADGTAAHAFAVTSPRMPLFTGAGFVVTRREGTVEHYLRPALEDGVPTLPAAHRTLLVEAVRAHLPEGVEAALAALNALYARGPRARIVTA